MRHAVLVEITLLRMRSMFFSGTHDVIRCSGNSRNYTILCCWNVAV